MPSDYDDQYSQYPAEWGLGSDPTFGEEFSAGAVTGVASIGLPVMGFGLVAGMESMENRVHRSIEKGVLSNIPGLKAPKVTDIGGVRPGWRGARKLQSVGHSLAEMQGGGLRHRASRLLGRGIRGLGSLPAMNIFGGALGAAGAIGGLAATMAPFMAAEAGVGYIADNLMEGAESRSHAINMMTQMGQIQGSQFGTESILGGGGFGHEAIRSWTMGGGTQSISNVARMSGIGREGVSDMAGMMSASGMIGQASGPEEFISKFRNKLQQVQQLSKSLDVSISEATQVMATLNQSGVGGEDQLRLGQFAGAVSGLTGHSLNTVMQHGISGADSAVQMGMTANQGAGLGMSNLSSVSVLGGLGALNEGLLARVGGEEGLAQRLTQISLGMSRSYGGQRMLSRLVNEEGSSIDVERLGDITAGGRRGRRRLDPYAMDELAQEFRENEGSIVLGQINRLRTRHEDDRDFNRAQYRFLAEMGISDPQEQLAYLQNLRSAPVMQVLESQQERRDAYSRRQEQGGFTDSSSVFADIGNNMLAPFGSSLGDVSSWIDENIGQPVQEFGRQFAEAMARAGDEISRLVHGSSPNDVQPFEIGAEGLSDYALNIWRGDVSRSFSRQDVMNLREQVGMPAERDYRGWWGRNNPLGAETDTRDSARLVAAVQSGQISQEQANEWGMTMWSAEGMTQEHRDYLESRGRLGNLTPIDLPGYQTGTDITVNPYQNLRMQTNVSPEGYVVFENMAGRMEALEFLESQGRGARGSDLDWFEEFGTTDEDLMRRISEATEDEGWRGFARVVGGELGYDSNNLTHTDQRTLERIAQDLMPDEIREAANVSVSGTGEEGFLAQEGAAAVRDWAVDLVSAGNRSRTVRERRRTEERIRQLRRGLAERADSLPSSGSYRIEPEDEVRRFGSDPVARRDRIRRRRELAREERRLESLNTSQGTEEQTEEITDAISTQAGRDWMQLEAARAEVEDLFGVSAQGGLAVVGPTGTVVVPREAGQARRLRQGRGSESDVEDLANAPWMPEELATELRGAVTETSEGLSIDEQTAGRIEEASNEAIRTAQSFAEDHSDEEAQARIHQIMSVREGGPQLTPTDAATRFLFSGLNPSSEQDRQVVRQWSRETGNSDTYDRFVGMAGDTEETWNHIVGRVVTQTRNASGVSEETMDLFRLGLRSDNAGGLSNALQSAEATQIDAARAEMIAAEYGPLMDRIREQVNTLDPGVVDPLNPDSRSEVGYFLDIMSGADRSIGSQGLASLRSEARVQGGVYRRRLEQAVGGSGLSSFMFGGVDIDARSREYEDEVYEELEESNQDQNMVRALMTAGRGMGRGGLDEAERLVIRELGAGGETLIQLDELMSSGNQEDIERLLASDPFGTGATDALLAEYGFLDPEDTEEGARGRAIERFAETLAAGEGEGEDLYAEMVGRAVASGFLSTDMLDERKGDLRDEENRQNLVQINERMGILASTVTGEESPSIRVSSEG